MTRALTMVAAAGLATSAYAQSTWNGAGDGQNWTDGGNWDTGIDPNGAGVDVVIDGNDMTDVEVWLDTFRTVGSLTISVDDSLRLLQGGGLSINGGLTNNGTFFIDADNGTSTDIIVDFVGDSTISGSGEIVMSDDFDNLIRSTAAVLTNGAGHTIRGGGGILANSGGLINNGAIIADAMNSQLRLDPGVEAFVNNGVLRATGAAGLLLGSGEYLNNTTIEATDGSRVDVANAAIVNGGSLTTSGSGAIFAFNGSDFTGVTLTGGSRVRQEQSQNTEVRGGLTNNGMWSVLSNDSTTTDTILDFVGSQMVSGSGAIELSDDFDNVIRSSAAVLTNGAGHTIRGAGLVLANSGGLINNGSLLATSNTFQLRIDPGVEGLTNNGVMRATGAAGMFLSSGVYTNNTAIEAQAGSVVEIGSSAAIVGGALTSGLGGLFQARNASDLTGVTLTAGSNLRQEQTQNIEIRNSLTNNGTWTIASNDSTTTDTIVDFVGTQSLSGGGTLVLSDDFDNLIRTSGAVVTHGAGHTIRGGGGLLANSGGLVNNGTIIADAMNNQLRLDPGIETFVNNGVLRATGAAGLLLGSGVYINNTAIEATGGSLIEVATSAEIRGGALITQGSGAIQARNGSDFTGVTLTAGSRIFQEQGKNVEIRDGIVNQGTWAIQATDATTTDVILDFVGEQTINGGGSLVMSDDFDNLIRSSGAVLTNGASHTIRGGGGLLANSGGVINNGTILADAANNQLRIDPGFEGFVNNGVLRATGAAGMLLGSGVFVNNSTIEAFDGSIIQLANAAEIRGGQLRTTGSGVFELLSGADLTNVRITPGSQVRQGQSQGVEVRMGLINIGHYRIESSSSTTTDTVLDFVGSQSVIGSGTIWMNDDADNLVRASGAVLTNGIGHTIRGAGTLLANSGGIVNLGYILAEGDNLLNINPGFEGFENTDRGTLGGTGTLNFVDGLLENDGILAAGINGVGTLGIIGDVTNSATAELAVQLDGGADLIEVEGSYEAGGMISVVLLGGFVPMPGQSLAVVTATDGVTSNFANAAADGSGVAAGVTSGGFTFDVIYEANQILISNVVPAPAAAGLLGLAGLFAARRRR